jgi:hypothetical protein
VLENARITIAEGGISADSLFDTATDCISKEEFICPEEVDKATGESCCRIKITNFVSSIKKRPDLA